MTKTHVNLKMAELIQIFCFLLFLLGSAVTLSEHGIELSLWLMTVAVVLSVAATVFPWLGMRWFKLERKGWLPGKWLAFLIQIASWVIFGFAMYQRLLRNLPPFYTLIICTMLLWAVWLILFIYSRHAYLDYE